MKRICIILGLILALIPASALANDAEQQDISEQAAAHGLTVSDDFKTVYTATSSDGTDSFDIITVTLTDSTKTTGLFVFSCENTTDATGTAQMQCDVVNYVIVS